MIKPNINNIFFYWGGGISESRKKILDDAVYSTRVFNPARPIYLVSNTLTNEDFDARFNIQVTPWDDTFFEDVPIPMEKLQHYKTGNHREFSDLFRLILMYKFGGSYIDTDDLAIQPITFEKHNIVCRSYDPHTCHYNKLTNDDCVPGKYREVPGYDHLNMFPRNDCWQNFHPKSKFIHEILTNEKFMKYEGIVYIGDDFSWQSLALETCKNNIEHINKEFHFLLTLMYLYEGFVAGSSYYDRCMYGGEFCDIWKQLPEVENFEWGKYKCDEETALLFYHTAINLLPYASHMWMHDKDMNEEWMLEQLDLNTNYSVSTWILNHVRKLIENYTP